MTIDYLLSNDDGIHATGLRVLSKTIQMLGEVRIIAPHKNCSGASSSLTLDAPLHPTKLYGNPRAIVVDGSPADCVHLAVTGFFDELPKRVISGINHGINMGDDVLYSGTLAAAIEGRFCEYSPLAVSLDGTTHFETAARVVATLLQSADFCAINGTIFNINVPDVPWQQLKGIRTTVLGKRSLPKKSYVVATPRNTVSHWIAESGEPIDTAATTDFTAIAQGFASITPISIDMTDTSRVAVMRNVIDTLIIAQA